MLLRELFERVIINEALSAGSNAVLAKPALVASLADEVRNDAFHNGRVFGTIDGKPAARILQKLSDEEVATWFLDSLDNLTSPGYEGVQYSQNGNINMWVAQSYANGYHTWEDITGKLPQIMRDFKLLMNQNPPVLPEKLRSLTGYKGIKELGSYVTIHYDQLLRDLREKSKNAEFINYIKKAARSIPIIDNDDYRVYITLNRAGAVKIGIGTIWCTASNNDNGYYFRYATPAALFQIFPKDATDVAVEKTDMQGRNRLIEGKEKYQFDAGGPNFMDIGDRPQRPADIKQRFPYLYDDLVKGLTQNKDKLQEFIDQSAENPALANDKTARVQPYNIDDEIRKLQRFVEKGYMSTTPRPAQIAEPEPEENT